MWFNSVQREEPYGLDIHRTSRDGLVPSGSTSEDRCCMAVVSFRVVKRIWVKSATSAALITLLPAVRSGTQRELPVINWRKVGMTRQVIMACDGGYTCYNGAYKEKRHSREQRGLISASKWSDWSLQLDSMVGIAGNRGSGNAAVRYVPGACTHRPSPWEWVAK